MARLMFYIQYAARNLWRNRRWSAFAMLSIAAGVATMVALRSLGLAIGDSLTSNIRSSNHGDITLEAGDTSFFFIEIGDEDSDEYFEENRLNVIRDWAQDNDAQIAEYKFSSLQVTALNQTSAGLLNFMTGLFIDPETYPPTQDIIALEPKGVPLGELFTGGQEAVISKNLADSQGLEVGDEIRVSGTEATFVVRGIVPTVSEAGLRDIFAAFFGFVYFDRSMTDVLSLDSRPNRISVLLPEGTTDDAILQAADELTSLSNRFGGRTRVISVPRLLEQNEVIADLTGRFVVVMGLGAMLIGGVGIINTMLVLVRRRTEEIAALKTFGLKGRQVAIMFMTEALLLGLIGSIVGSIGGALLSRATNAYGEAFIQQPLAWRIYPEALLFGLVLGLVVTAVFGVMPVLTAVKVRPGIILRPNETHIPALGIVQSILATLFVVLSLGLIAGQIVGPFPEEVEVFPFEAPIPDHLMLGVIGVTVTLIILALLVGIMWILVWIVGRFPAFGWIDLRLALTNLRSRRLRTATTLLAISVGMFALSSIAFYGAGVREILQFTLTDTLGGNVMILSPASLANVPIVADAAQAQLDRRLDTMGEAVQYRTQFLNYEGQIVEVDGVSYRNADNADQRRELREARNQARLEGDTERADQLSLELSRLSRTYIPVSMQISDNPRLVSGEVVSGRKLTPDDIGQQKAVMRADFYILEKGVDVGSQVTISIDGRREFTFEVVGLLSSEDGPGEGIGDMQIPGDTLDGLRPEFRMNTIMVDPDHMSDVLLEIASMPTFFPINVAFLDGVLGRLIDQFSALPLLVGLLSLAAAAVIMANTVALATLERRKQIGILKAVGLKSKRVIAIMLLENTLVSLLGGFIGIGLSAIGVAVMTYFGLGDLVLIPADAQSVAVALVVAAVGIGGAATVLSARPAARERVMNVLRYE